MNKLLKEPCRIVLVGEQPEAVKPLYDWIKTVNRGKANDEMSAVIGQPIWYNDGRVEVLFRPISAEAATKIHDILADDYVPDVRNDSRAPEQTVRERVGRWLKKYAAAMMEGPSGIVTSFDEDSDALLREIGLIV